VGAAAAGGADCDYRGATPEHLRTALEAHDRELQTLREARDARLRATRRSDAIRFALALFLGLGVLALALSRTCSGPRSPQTESP